MKAAKKSALKVSLEEAKQQISSLYDIFLKKPNKTSFMNFLYNWYSKWELPDTEYRKVTFGGRVIVGGPIYPTCRAISDTNGYCHQCTVRTKCPSREFFLNNQIKYNGESMKLYDFVFKLQEEIKKVSKSDIAAYVLQFIEIRQQELYALEQYINSL